MSEETPISHDITDPVTIDTGADQQQVGDINKSFQDFWASEDNKTGASAAPPTEPAPAAPGDSAAAGAGQETKTAKTIAPSEPPAEPVKEKKGVAPVQKPPPEAKVPVEQPQQPSAAKGERSFTDDEIDRLALPSHSRPELIDDFKKVKQWWKADRARMKEIEQRLESAQGELSTAKANAWTPEQRADYEHAAEVRRRFDFVSDPEFVERYHAPIRNRFEAILEEAVPVLADPVAAREWANFIKANYQPDQLSRQWWLRDVIEKVPNDLDRQSLLASVTELLRMQKERDTEISRRTGDKSAFDNWINEKAQTTAQRVHQEVMAEIGEQERRIQEVLPKDVEAAKTNEERAAIEAHNERFKNLNQHFVKTMQDLSKNGPRAWVRASVEATRALMLDQEYGKLQEELKTIRAERDQYKTELDKIHSARRKLSQSGTAASTPAKANQGLSVKDLDIRKAFDTYDWESNSR
jgi:predicted  nucleic acid-binding Zn-ribbon protein